ncbi:MAG: two-component sensor histidine kinase [Rhodoferax sp.]|nr:two-component sensor histidine kinase [Rhodoferax sp.]
MAQDIDKKIAELKAELALVRDELQGFTYTVSHDLRAPLRHIIAYASMVQEDAGASLSEEVQGFLATITDSARHLGVLLDGLTALSRLGTVELAIQPVDLGPLVHDVCADLKRQNPHRALQWCVAEGFPEVQADAALLRQALHHVLENAVKFTRPRASAQIEIFTAVENVEDCLALVVRDNGVGYNPAHQGRLFQVFGRLHSVAEFEGIGMGLVLTRKIFQRIGGLVDIHCVPEGGACVRLQLRKVQAGSLLQSGV